MRILLVEDNEKLANSLKKSLKAESYAIDTCFDGKEAYESILIEEYDLIILDIGLPGMDGLTLCQKIREEKISTPILMLTARDAINDKITGLDKGADDYIIKPFNFEELLARIRALLRRGTGEPTLIYEVASLKLIPSSHIVTRAGKEVRLTAKEYALLEFLLRHAHQIVSKSQIIDHVWDIDIDPFSNVIDVYIGYLRKKIDKDFPKEEPLVYTIKGIGYKIGK